MKLKLFSLLSVINLSYCLLPLPKNLQQGQTYLTLHNDLSVTTNNDDTFQPIIQTTLQSLQTSNHRRLSIDLGLSDVESLSNAKSINTLNVNVNNTSLSITDLFNSPLEQRDESYSLTIPDDEDDITATINTNTILGLHRALSTFQQLFYVNPNDKNVKYLNNAPVKIEDSPEFGWRSVMLDTSRNYYSLDALKSLIESMSFVKLSIFHWHITDQHSWPLIVDSHPELHEKGSYPGMTYSKDDITDIINYGKDRGVDVVVELDLPGHTQSVAESHPDLVSCIDRRPWSSYAAEPPAGQLDLENDDVTPFVYEVLDDLLPIIQSNYFGTGGDELNPKCYDMDVSTLAPLVREFQSNLGDKLNEYKKTAVVWHELSTEYDMPLPDDTLVINWSTADFASEILSSQPGTVKIIHAASDYMYLDCGTGGWLGNSPDGTSWCDPFKSWQKVFISILFFFFNFI